MPRVLNILRGNPSRRPISSDPDPPAHNLQPPDWLDIEARAEWDRMAPKLLALGLLSELDGDALATYCQHWSRWKEAELKVRQHGMVIKGKGGYPVVSPYVAIATRAMQDMKSMLVEFGMTPSARNRVKATKQKQAADPFSEFDDVQPWSG